MQAQRWNILDAEGNVVNTIMATSDFVAAHHPFAEALPDAPPAQRLALVVTAIASSNEPSTSVQPDFSEVSCPVGTTLAITAELRAGENVFPVTRKFLMPVTSRDGREHILQAWMVDGVATVTVTAPFAESGLWRVTEAEINGGLPIDMQMSFAGISIFVVW